MVQNGDFLAKKIFYLKELLFDFSLKVILSIVLKVNTNLLSLILIVYSFFFIAGVCPDGAQLEMQIFGGKCTDQEAMDKLKKDFVDTLLKDFILNYLFCTDHAQNCAIENIVVYCAKRKRRNTDGSQSSSVRVKFAFAVREKKLASASSADMKQLQILSANLEKEKSTILKNVRIFFQICFKDRRKRC